MTLLKTVKKHISNVSFINVISKVIICKVFISIVIVFKMVYLTMNSE